MLKQNIPFVFSLSIWPGDMADPKIKKKQHFEWGSF